MERAGLRMTALLAAGLALALAACARTPPPAVLEPVPAVRPEAIALRALPVVERHQELGRSWVIFYSPHPDDETIGMGQAIRRCVDAGYNVQLVCLTDGVTSRSYEGYYRKNPRLWRDLDHNGVKGDRGDFGLERRLEFTRAARALGVPESRIAFCGMAASNDPHRKDFISSDRITEIMRSYEALHPGALHVTVMKHTDGDPDGPGDYYAQAEHTAACDALLRLARTSRFRAEFYKVYVYDLPKSRRWAPVVEVDARAHPAKRKALFDGYDDAGKPRHLAIGWHSVPVTIDEVLLDDREYRVPLASIPR